VNRERIEAGTGRFYRGMQEIHGRREKAEFPEPGVLTAEHAEYAEKEGKRL
jgi:hypothetical protein